MTAILPFQAEYLYWPLQHCGQQVHLTETKLHSVTNSDKREEKKYFSFGPFLCLYCIKYVCVAEDPMNKSFVQCYPAICLKSIFAYSGLRHPGRNYAILSTVYIKRFLHGWNFSLLQEFHHNTSVDMSNQFCCTFSIQTPIMEKQKPVSTKLRPEELAFPPLSVAYSCAAAGCDLITQHPATSGGSAGMLAYMKLNFWRARGGMWQLVIFGGLFKHWWTSCLKH